MPQVNIRNKVYALASVDGTNAELTLYGEIVETRPVDGWTGKPLEGDFIMLDEFLRDLETISGCKELLVRINSYGGDAGVSNTIHNRLREMARNGTKLTCIVDSVAMSGGSLIMCACDTVKVCTSSLIMIHKCWSFLWGSYNADDLRKQAEKQDAWDNMQVEIYKRKTGLSDTVLKHMMGETTYMTGREAIEKGFADELIEDAEPAKVAASADGKCLYVNGRKMHLAPGMVLPKQIPIMQEDPQNLVNPEPDNSVETNTPPDDTGREGGHNMTLEEFRAQHPEEYAQLVNEVQAGADHSEAVQAERSRIAAIDEISSLFAPDMVQEAKYGQTACDAKELAFRAAQAAAKNGQKFLQALDDDANSGGTNDVQASPNGGENPAGGDDIIADVKAAVEQFKKINGEVV